jgi:hypothetical protein
MPDYSLVDGVSLTLPIVYLILYKYKWKQSKKKIISSLLCKKIFDGATCRQEAKYKDLDPI